MIINCYARQRAQAPLTRYELIVMFLLTVALKIAINEVRYEYSHPRYAAQGIIKAVEHLRSMSPLYDLHNEGIDISTIDWQSH